MNYDGVIPIVRYFENRMRIARTAVMTLLALVFGAGFGLMLGGAVEALAPTKDVWLAGDLHVHTCYSHDAYCGPGDDNTGPDEAYTAGVPVEARFKEAAARGLDYLAITDHNDIRSATDPGFGTSGVIGIPGYEASIRGHAQMLGTTQIYDAGDQSTAAIQGMENTLHKTGGVFQINHPADGLKTPMASCDDTSNLNWKYGYDIVPDTIEVWNISHLVQPPVPAGMSNEDSAKYWECWLQRGVKVGATGGSDAHWAATTAHGPGHPTTWVFAKQRNAEGVLEGLREGRTSISMLPPKEGGAQLLLEGDANGDGNYKAMIGDEVPPGTDMRVRAIGQQAAGLVQVRANGKTILNDAPLAPGGEVRFKAPSKPGWVRATLLLPDATAERDTVCDPIAGNITSYCRNKLLVAAMTSPIYLQQRKTTLDLSIPDSGHYTDPMELRATLTTGDTPLADRTVTFSLPGKSVIAKTDKRGVARASLDLNAPPGPAEIKVSYAGEDGYLASERSAPIEVRREETSIKFTGETTAQGNTIRAAAVLSENDGPPIPGKTVSFEIGDRTVTAVTDASGKAEAIIKATGHGRSEKITARFEADQYFEAASTSDTVRWGRD